MCSLAFAISFVILERAERKKRARDRRKRHGTKPGNRWESKKNPSTCCGAMVEGLANNPYFDTMHPLWL